MKTLEEAIEKIMGLVSSNNKEIISKKHGMYKHSKSDIDTHHLGKLEMVELLSYIYEQDTVILPSKVSEILWAEEK
jgi:hypothetical protein